MPILGVIFDLGHTLMELRGTWPEMFDRGAADLTAFVDGRRPPLWPVPAGREFAQALLERRKQGFARADATLREVTAEASIRWTFWPVSACPSPSLTS
jgi:hypothetical protein